MTNETDILNIALTDQRTGNPLIVERVDGHRSITDLAWWRRDTQATPPIDTELITWAKPGTTAIDLGCATGRHLDILTSHNIHAYGIEINQHAAHLARTHGHTAITTDATSWSPLTPVDTVFAFGGDTGICGTVTKLHSWLTHLSTWLKPGGQLIVTSVDWRNSTGHENWIATSAADGKYPGDVRLRLRYGHHVGPWFDWIWIDPDTLIEVGKQAGFSIGRRASWSAKYGLELLKTGEAA